MAEKKKTTKKTKAKAKVKKKDKFFGNDRVVKVLGEKQKIGKEEFYLAKLEQTNDKGQVVNTITKHVPAKVIDNDK